LCLPVWFDHVKKVGMGGKPSVCHCADGYRFGEDGRSCVKEKESQNAPAQSTTAHESNRVEDIKSSGRTAFVTVAFVGCVALVVAFIAYAVWRHMNRNTRRPKRFTLENPVYRRTVVDGGYAGDQYDHLRLSSDSGRHYHPGAITGNGVSSAVRGSGVYQPTTTMSHDDMAEPDSMGVGVVQNGKYSMKLPLTEHEEGPDYS